MCWPNKNFARESNTHKERKRPRYMTSNYICNLFSRALMSYTSDVNAAWRGLLGGLEKRLNGEEKNNSINSVRMYNIYILVYIKLHCSTSKP